MDSNEYIEDGYACIKQMEGVGDYLHRWKSVRQIWAPRLDKGPVSQKEDFTPHNHKNHNVGIYKILSEILIPESAYKSTLSVESLFVLNVSVLLHDIMMTYKPSARAQHSKEAREFIQKLFRHEDFNITPPEMEAIELVILGHSDIKDDQTKATISTIDMLPNEEMNFINGVQGKINALLLSALLRLGDELDIHNMRIQGFSFNRRDIMATSVPHWRRCEILKYPRKNPVDVTAIQLVPFDSCITAEGNIDNDIREILEVRNKISKELAELNCKVFNKGFLPGWCYNKIEINATGEILETIKKLENKSLNPFSSETESPISEFFTGTVVSKNDFEQAETISEWQTTVAEKEVVDKITNWVLQKDLLHSGHFKVGDKYRARDWIDTQGLLEDRKCLDFITDKFAKKISEFGEKTFFIGIDHYGLLIAALLGVKTNSPFSYIISERLSAAHIKKEKEIVVPPGHHVVLVTDAIVTFSTVLSAREFLMDNCIIRDDHILGIYSVFQRGALLTCEGPHCSELLKKVYVLNNAFPVEICNKEQCVFVLNDKNLYCNVPQDI